MKRRLAVTVGALALIAPASSSAATIDFESLTPGATVNSQYSSDGVTFNGPKVRTYPGGVAHSGTKGIEVCFGAEFCSAPVRVDFTSGQTEVGLWVGNYDYDAPAPENVRLTALDASGNTVGTANAILPAGTNPVATHLSVTTASPEIFAFKFGRVGDDNATGYSIDDVEYSTAGPPPPCTATGPPTVGLTSPIDGSELQNNQILLKGLAFARGAPITEATVVSQGTTTRTAFAFPTPIDANGGSFAINMNGLLQEGRQAIHVTVTNCAGTGTSTNQVVTYEPLPATAGFQQLAPVELVQTVQSPYNPVPLIAGGPNGTKRTIARVPLAATGVSAPITGVSGRLTATRPDGSVPGGPISIDSLNTISVAPDQTLEAARSSLNSTLNFELPPEWVTEGQLHVQLEQLKIEGAQTLLPCQYCDNYGGISAVKTFHRVPPLSIWLVSVPYEIKSGGVSTTFAPRQMDVDFLASWLRRAYPASEVRVMQATLPTQGRGPGWDDMDDDGIDENRPGFLCGDINTQLSRFAQTVPTQPRGTRYYGLVSDGFNFMRGCSNIGGQTGSGPAGDGRWAWDRDNTYTDWYGGHEIGHLFDRRHPDGGCDDSDDDGSFPYLGGSIGNFLFDNQGLDVGDASLSAAPPMALYDWRPSTLSPGGFTDIMTYCDDEWMSSYTYNGILRNLCGNDAANCPNRAQLTKAEAKGGGTMLAVTGTLDLATQKVSLEPMSALKGLTLSKRPGKSDYAIVQRDARGKVVGSYPFEPKEISENEGPGRPGSIDEVVPFSKKTKTIEIARGDDVLASRRVSAHAPTVKLASPKGKSLDKPVKLRWKTGDVDGDRRQSTLQYAADGKHYVTVAAGLKRGPYKVDPADLPGGEKARFRVIVTDGVLTAIDKTRRYKVAPKAPRIAIATPVDQATFNEGQSVQLVASVADDQDARLADEVIWSSDVQGELGRGGALATKLEPGVHKLTATVTNSLGMTSSASVSVTVEATPETVDAELVP